MSTPPLPPGKVSLSMLSSHLRVISTSPAWPTVQTAMANLARAEETGPYPSQAADVLCVREYARMLAASAPTVADALVCGLVVGTASGAVGRGERILVGLDVIARAHRFAEKTDAEVVRTFKDLLAALQEEYHLPLSPRLQAPGSERFDPKSWKQDLSDRLARADQPGLFQGEEKRILAEKAWRSWRQRTHHFFLGARRPEPTLSDLLALAAGLPAARLLRLDLREMTVVEWSTALLGTLEGDAPLWVAVAALLALGFRSRSWPSVADWANQQSWSLRTEARMEEDLMVAETWSRRQSHLPGGAVLILKKREESAVDAWLPSPTLAAAAMTVEQASLLLRVLGRRTEGPPLEPAFNRIVLEMPMEKAMSREVSRICQALPATEGRLLYLYPQPPGERPPGPYVIAPKALEELLEAQS